MKRAIAAATAAISILGAAAVLAAAVYGKIGEKYAQLGADRGPLGAALTDEAPAARCGPVT